MEGHPAQVLTHAATNAQLLVIGAHRHHLTREANLGSVSRHYASRASCPVVIVHSAKTTTPPPPPDRPNRPTPETPATTPPTAEIGGFGSTITDPVRLPGECRKPNLQRDAAFPHPTSLVTRDQLAAY